MLAKVTRYTVYTISIICIWFTNCVTVSSPHGRVTLLYIITIFHTLHYSDRFKLLKRRKTGGAEKLKKSVSSTSGISGHSESSLLQSCSLPPTVVHSTKGGGAGRSRDPTKGLCQSSGELGRYEDGISVWKKKKKNQRSSLFINIISGLSPVPVSSFACMMLWYCKSR